VTGLRPSSTGGGDGTSSLLDQRRCAGGDEHVAFHLESSEGVEVEVVVGE
jgi:hypothetical protein